MKVSIFNRQKALPVDKRVVKKIVAFFLLQEKISCDEVGIYFVEKEEICPLHEKFFEDPSPTDCISFPIAPPKSRSTEFCFLGEIFICSEVALEYASCHRLDPLEEQALYLIHGLLHLIGYDDQSLTERRCMRKKEKNYMKVVREILKKKK